MIRQVVHSIKVNQKTKTHLKFLIFAYLFCIYYKDSSFLRMYILNFLNLFVLILKLIKFVFLLFIINLLWFIIINLYLNIIK